NTAPNLTANQSWRGAYVRTAPSDWRQADAAAAFAYEELGGETAVILHDGGEYASGLAAAFAASWRDRGGAVLFEHEIAVGQTDFDEALTGLAFSPPDVLYLPLFEPEAGAIANTLYGVSGLEAVTLIGAENLLHPDFPQSAGAAVEGMYLTGTAVPSDEYDIFLAKWDVKFGGSPLAAYHAHAYDATNILLNAIEASAQESADGTLLIGRGALRQAIADTTDFAGLTGTLTCDAAGDCASEAALGIYQITAEEIAGTYWPPPLLWTP
ncbi:MAG: ABC transporter substrate-binding protein, partial [Chloroflexi bacterium]|nr:ABC transporter substrate-binding protein [Chloroflexota bacterium]